MFYKIVNVKNDSVEDVFDRLVYCKYEPRSKYIMICTEAEKQGVISARRDTYFHIKGWTPFGIEAQECDLYEITESEYLELKNALDKEYPTDELGKKVDEHSVNISDIEDAIAELAEIIGG